MAQKTREQLNTANAALFVNNSTGNITPALEKAFNEDVNDSAVNIKGDTFAADAEFAFQNNSKLREGAIAHGFGGGIARVCANEKADQWEDGFRYLIQTSGSTNTVVYVENMNGTNPGDNDDETKSYAVGSRWKNLVSGIEYVCTQANEGDAIWIPVLTNFKVTLSASDLFNGVTKDIPECPAPSLGFAWVVTNAQLLYTFGTEPYDAAQVRIRVTGTTRPQFTDSDATQASDSFNMSMTPYTTADGADVTIIENAGLEAFVQGGSTTGDGTAIIYGQAILLSL